MKKIGLIGGIGPESTLDYYRLIIRAVQERIGALKARAEAVRKAQAAAERVAASKRRPRSAPSARPLAQVSQVQFVDGVWAHRVVVDVKGPISHTLARTGRQSLTVSLARASIPADWSMPSTWCPASYKMPS